jgi:uncharacterized protein (TIGR02118 family)
MTFKVSVYYPKKDDATFNMDYYTGSHMPLCESLFKEQGLLSWDVVQYDSPDAGFPFTVSATMTFKDEQSYKTAFAPDSPAVKQIIGDVPNYSNYPPVFTSPKAVVEKSVL